jgi:hypothetical protein
MVRQLNLVRGRLSWRPLSFLQALFSCRVRESLRSTSAMVLGIADHVWSLSELIDAALAQVPPDLGRRHKKPTLSVIDGGKI